MIKATELRIGNKIKLNDEIRNVEMIHDNGMTIGKITNGFYADGYFEDFDPIPLTPELLEQCGFITPDYKLPFGDYEILMKRRDDGTWHAWINYERSAMEKECGEGHYNVYHLSFPCQYLHSLQNLYFALAGEELQIKNEI